MSNYLSPNNTETTTETTTDDDSDSNPLAQPKKDLNYYRAELTGLWRKTVEDIIATGRVFSEAKNDLTPGEYKDLMAEFGFERSIAARLRAIYHCLENVDNYLQKRLPASVSTIYEMSKAGPELLEAKLRRGEWTTTTTRADIAPRKPKPPKQEPSPVNQFRRFYQGKHRQAMIDELVNNPVLCETVPKEIEELMKEVRERRRQGNGQDRKETAQQQPQQPPTTPSRPLPSRFGYGGWSKFGESSRKGILAFFKLLVTLVRRHRATRIRGIPLKPTDSQTMSAFQRIQQPLDFLRRLPASHQPSSLDLPHSPIPVEGDGHL